MERQEAVEALQLLRRVVSQARDESALQNWGLIWMLHGVTNAAGFVCTDLLVWRGLHEWHLLGLWSVVVTVNIGLVVLIKKKAGARSFVETQLWAIWLTFVAAMPLLGLLNAVMDLPPMTLAPVVGLFAAFAFAMMATLIDRSFGLATAIFVGATLAMAWVPTYQWTIFGAVWGVTQIVWGGLLHRQKARAVGAAQIV